MNFIKSMISIHIGHSKQYIHYHQMKKDSGQASHNYITIFFEDI